MDDGLLHHYTNNAGVEGILRTGELWFSDVRFLNDSREIHCALEVGEKLIRKVSERYRVEYQKAGFTQWEEWLEKILNVMRHNSHHYHSESRTTPFSFSMTRKYDTLSQWRGYGNGEYCISFDTKNLLKKIAADGAGLELTEVEYPTVDVENPAAEIQISRFFRDYLCYVDDQGQMDTEVFMDGASLFFSPPKLYNAAFLGRYKDQGFREEEEARLVIDIAPTDERVIFNTMGLYPRPRAKIKIFDPAKAFDIVPKITIGPGMDRDLAETAISMLCTRTGSRQIKVCSSRIPYPGGHYKKSRGRHGNAAQHPTPALPGRRSLGRMGRPTLRLSPAEVRKARSACSPQCQVSSKASIWASAPLPEGPLNRTL
jgi:hypothetical protein